MWKYLKDNKNAHMRKIIFVISSQEGRNIKFLRRNCYLEWNTVKFLEMLRHNIYVTMYKDILIFSYYMTNSRRKRSIGLGLTDKLGIKSLKLFRNNLFCKNLNLRLQFSLYHEEGCRYSKEHHIMELMAYPSAIDFFLFQSSFSIL